MFGNPRFNVRGVVRETLVPAGIGAGGAILTDIAFAYASPYLPAALQSGMLPVLAKLGVALGVGFAAGKIAGRRIGQAVTLGGVTVVAYGAIKGTLATALPTVKGLSGFQDFVDYSVTGTGARGGMGAYMQAPRLGFYSPAPVVGGSGMGAYMPAAAAPAPALHGLNGDGYNWQNDGM
jgi:hypothetical protein